MWLCAQGHRKKEAERARRATSRQLFADIAQLLSLPRNHSRIVLLQRALHCLQALDAHSQQIAQFVEIDMSISSAAVKQARGEVAAAAPQAPKHTPQPEPHPHPPPPAASVEQGAAGRGGEERGGVIGSTRGVGSRCLLLGDGLRDSQSLNSMLAPLKHMPPHATTLVHQAPVVDLATLPAQAAAPDGVRERDKDDWVVQGCVLVDGGQRARSARTLQQHTTLQQHWTKNSRRQQDERSNMTLPQLVHKNHPTSRMVRERRGREHMRSILTLMVCCPCPTILWMLFAPCSGPKTSFSLLPCQMSLAHPVRSRCSSLVPTCPWTWSLSSGRTWVSVSCGMLLTCGLLWWQRGVLEAPAHEGLNPLLVRAAHCLRRLPPHTCRACTPTPPAPAPAAAAGMWREARQQGI